MASAPVATVKLKLDLSDITQLLTQELDLDDPLAEAIMANVGGVELPVVATIGLQVFELHHWTVSTVDGASRLRTGWREIS